MLTEKGTDTVKTPRSPAKRAAHFSCFFPPLLFLLLSRLTVFRFAFPLCTISSGKSSAWANFSLFRCSPASTSVGNCPFTSYLYTGLGYRNTFIDLSLVIMHTKGFWCRYSLDEVALQGALFFFVFLMCIMTAASFSSHPLFLLMPALKLEHLSILCNGFISGTLSLPLVFAPRTAQ